MGRFAAIAVAALLVAAAVWAALPRKIESAGDDPARIDACLAAQREVAARRQARNAPAPPGQPSDAGVVSRACAPLYREAACKDAMLRFDEPPVEARSATVFQACARAYCPLLPAPKPAACANTDVVPSEQFVAWSELRLAILTRDLGPEAAQRVLAPAR